MLITRQVTKGLVVVAICGLISGCAQTFHKPLADQSRSKINEMELRVLVIQEGPTFSARAPGVAAAAGGGLIPALIDASIQKSRQIELGSQIKSVLDAADGYDFRAAYAANLSTAVESRFPFKVTKQSVVSYSASAQGNEAAISGTKNGKALLILTTHYELEPNLTALSIRTAASMWYDGIPEKAYNNHLIFQAPVKSLDVGKNAALWAADGGKLFRDQCALGIRETVKMLVMDLEARGIIEPQGTADKASATNFSVNVAGVSQSIPGTKVASGDGRIVMRDKDGALFSLPQ